MNYERIHQTLQQQFVPVMPLMPAQIARIVLLCRSVFVTSRIYLSFLARCLPIASQQDSRIRWIKRLLQAKFMTQDLVYQPVLQASLQGFKLGTWHLIIDRTALVEGDTDLVTISLNYHQRALPLIWRQIAYGGVALEDYVALVHECAKLIPEDARVVFHGDVEFGGAKMIRALRFLGWDFILAQRNHVHFYHRGQTKSQALNSLPLTGKRSYQLAQLDLFASERIGAINLVAFKHKRYDQHGHMIEAICYLATSLPLSQPIRRLGKRRWGIEPFHRDYKSSGWQIDQSHLQKSDLRDGLLIILALCYLLTVCLGRKLCKIGNRAQVDNHAKRHLSLFRLGWDFIVHCVNSEQSIPFRLCLYS